MKIDFDVVIIGSGVSGSVWAQTLSQSGIRCLLLEAGKLFSPLTLPRFESQASYDMYWSGGMELNTSASLGFLRPKVVGGGSMVNQALIERFDAIAWNDFKQASKISYFNSQDMESYYQKIEQQLITQKIPTTCANENAKIFAEGLEKQGHQFKVLTRAQSNCDYLAGDDCLACLGGCPKNSKQSMMMNFLNRAIQQGCQLFSQFQVENIQHHPQYVMVSGTDAQGFKQSFTAKAGVLAAGSVGNARLLFSSQMASEGLGQGFYCHPQYMTLAVYDRPIHAEKGPFQVYQSSDPLFRQNGFKLENVFAPPIALAMLLPQIGKRHLRLMKKITQMACIEVAIRDTQPGSILHLGKGKIKIHKELNSEDKKRKKLGLMVVESVFEKSQAEQIIHGQLPIGLHLMGGLSIGENPNFNVINQNFQHHHYQRIFCSDSSIFPNAPGINPSFSIMALSQKAAELFKENFHVL
jgi:choline dehydrogenase-like flavoprotein